MDNGHFETVIRHLRSPFFLVKKILENENVACLIWQHITIWGSKIRITLYIVTKYSTWLDTFRGSKFTIVMIVMNKRVHFSRIILFQFAGFAKANDFKQA